jgi:virginiamycin B lyase
MINPATNAITEFALPNANSGPTFITAGPDGNVWFTEYSGNKVSRITPDGVISEFPVPTAGSLPYRIVAGPDGNIWFTEAGAGKIGRINP